MIPRPLLEILIFDIVLENKSPLWAPVENDLIIRYFSNLCRFVMRFCQKVKNRPLVNLPFLVINHGQPNSDASLFKRINNQFTFDDNITQSITEELKLESHEISILLDVA